MSQIMEKTLASLPKLLTQGLIGGKPTKPTARQTPSQDVQSFMKFVHRARSKSHEAAIIHAELADLQQKFKQIDLTASSWLVRNSFTKAIFCHLLGYDVTFVAIYAINLAQQGKGYDKRLGYLLCCLLLNRYHEMVMLMMATLLRDLKSSSMNDNCIALLVAGELVGEEDIPSLLPEVIKKLNHSHELVREKALHCFRAFYQAVPNLLQPSMPELNMFLTSRDPGVLNAVINIFLLLSSENPVKYTGLGHSFLHILHQINHRGFGTNYYYHMIPLPWLQISLLKILGNLGSVDTQVGEQTAPLLQALIEKTKVTEPISLAVLVESVSTAVKINANEQLLGLCSRCIGKLLSSDASNGMKYQGLGLLISLSRVRSSYAAQHQLAVVECLSDEDPAIQVRTTQLLHAMANRANVKAVCGRLFDQAQKTNDKVFVHDILLMISDVAERLMIDSDWYINTYLSLLDFALDRRREETFINLVLSRMERLSRKTELIPEDSISNLITVLLHVLETPKSTQPAILLSLQIFGVLAPVIDQNFPKVKFLTTAERFFLSSEMQKTSQKQTVIIKPPVQPGNISEHDQKDEFLNIQCCCLDTILKLVLSGCLDIISVREWLDKHRLRQLIKKSFIYRALDELEEIIQHPEHLRTRCEIMFQPQNTTIDVSFSFLDGLIVQDLLRGKKPVKPNYVILAEQLKFSPIETPDQDNQNSNISADAASALDASKASSSGSSKMSKSFIRVKNKWREDDNDEEEEKFLIVDADDDEEMEKFEERKRKEGIMKELFAGVEENDTSQLFGSRSPSHNKKTFKSLWDDDEEGDENKSLIGSTLGLHPFGISRKGKTSQQPRWYEDDFENDNLTFTQGDSVESAFISSKLEKAESPSGLNSSLYGEYDIVSNPSQLGDMSNSSLHSPSLQNYPTNSLITPAMTTVHAARSHPSIYSESIGELSTPTGTTSSGTMSVSTIDALTDSEPEDSHM